MIEPFQNFLEINKKRSYFFVDMIDDEKSSEKYQTSHELLQEMFKKL